MKQLKTMLLAGAAIFLFSGCDKFNEKTFDTTIIQNFTIDKASGDPLVIDLTELISAVEENPDLEEVKENIKNYELVRIYYKVFEYWTDTPGVDILFNGSLGIGNRNATAAGVSYQFSDISLLSGSEDDAFIDIPLNSSDIDKVEQYFLDTNGLKLFLDGSVSSTPVHFVLQVKVDIKTKAEVED